MSPIAPLLFYFFPNKRTHVGFFKTNVTIRIDDDTVAEQMSPTKHTMNEKTLLIFDIDGTLLQTELVTVPAVQQAFAAYGLKTPSREAICAFFGKPVEAYEAWLESQCPASQAAAVVAKANALELRFIGEFGKLYPGVPECLSSLTGEGYVLALCSNGPEPYVREVVEAHGLRRFVAAVRARGAGYRDKAEMVGTLLSELQPQRFALVGDRREDIEAAHAHTGFGIAATYGFGSPEEWLAADACIHAIPELPTCVQRLFSSGRVDG